MSPDYLIIGAGVVGLTVARALAAARPGAKIVILEKESEAGFHASGRNSGVVHAGIYYAPGSLKARLSVDGARRMIQFCKEKRLPLRETGKIILPTVPGDESRLLDLHARAVGNGVTVELIDDARLKEIEPAAHPVEKALYSPNTASLEPRAVLDALIEELDAKGVTVTFGVGVTAVDAVRREVALTTGGRLSFGFLVNAAGAHADRLAHGMGVGKQYMLVPFRGEYCEISPAANLGLKTQLYPVPDPDLPFLGVHMTVSCSGKIYVGPSAKPALGREHYHGLSGVDWTTLSGLLMTKLGLFLGNRSGFRRHARVEMRRLLPSRFLEEARRLVPALEARHLVPSKKRGIRAQLYDKDRRVLEMDFLALDGPASLHVLNAVSPGFTASFAFADYLLERINGRETSR